MRKNIQNLIMPFAPEIEISAISAIFNSAEIAENLDPLEGALAYKTASHEIIHCNKKFLFYAGYKNVKSIAGKTDRDLIWQEYSNIYHQQENDALNGEIYSALYPGKDSHGRNVLFFSQKSLWTNEQGKTLGIISYGLEIQSIPFAELSQFLKKTTPHNHNPNHGFLLGKKSLADTLSPRERECLFYIMRGQTAKSIANILGISYYTVATYIDRLKVKFNAQTKTELIDAAIKAGLLNILPPNLPSEKTLKSLKNK